MPEKNKDNSLTGEIKDIRLDYNNQIASPAEISEDKKKDMEKTKKELEEFKNKILKKFKFVFGMGILPPQASKIIEEEERIPKQEAEKKLIHVLVLMPEEKFKNIKKIEAEIVDEAKKLKQSVWIHVKTPIDIWNYGLDGKYDILSALSMCFPLYDKNNFLGSLRVAEIHKSLVLKKFEKYVTSYILAGSLVRGDTTKQSDVDVAVIIDDTDVKRMPRLQLKEKLRNIIYSYVMEAGELAGVKNKLNVQVWILTEFWEGVKDANPVFFTYIRDGTPLYDRGTFMPWKALLKMGKITPSPESVDKFMSMGEKVEDRVKRTLTDLVIGDIYWGVLTPAQALLMLYGLPPPTTKEAPKLFLDTFVKKEKLLEKKYADILTKIVKTYKDFEHGKIKDGDLKGEDVDKFLKQAEDFLKRLKELREQIEKRARENTIDNLYEDILDLLKNIFHKKSEMALIKDFEKEFVEKGKMPRKSIETIKLVSKLKKKKNQKKSASRNEVENARIKAVSLINDLVEYNQRCELIGLEKGKIKVKTDEKEFELILSSPTFLIDKGKISKIDLNKNKLVESDIKEMTAALEKQKNKQEIKIDERIFEFLKQNFKDYKIYL